MRVPVSRAPAIEPAVNADNHYQLLADCLEKGRLGDRQGVDEIIRTLTPLLWQVARAQGLQRHDAEDAVQTVWLRFIRHIDDIRSPRALTSWLVTTARREAWQISNSARRQPAPAAESFAEIADDTPGPEQLADDDERRRSIWANLMKLPPRCRQLLRVVAFADRPDYQAVAQALGMPVGSIGPTRGRCLAKLRALLSNDSSWSYP